MRRWLLALSAALAAMLACVAPSGAPTETVAAPVVENGTEGMPATVVWVSVSGLTPDRYLRDDADMPWLGAIARVGVAAERVESITPSATYPVHATLMTGLGPDMHGIHADRRVGEHGVRKELHRHASLMRAVPLWQRVVEDGGVVVALDWPGTQGADIPVLLPDIGPGSGAGDAWNMTAAREGTPELASVVRAAATASRPGAERDALVSRIACAALAAEPAPRLVLLRLRGAERSLAGSGPRSAAAGSAFEAVDGHLGDLLACSANVAGGVALIASGDVAYEPTHTMLRPNKVLSEAGLLERNAPWQALVRSNGGSAFVYADGERAALEARRALGKAARETGAFRVIGADEMIARSADPEAWFGLDAEPGFVFVDDGDGPLESPARMLGAGGGLDAGLRPTAGIVLWGRGVRSGVRVPVFSLLDAGPTAAALLGVSLDPAKGRPRLGLLRRGSRPE